nr:hypothetical protein [Candidatus Cloacimonadota bacterium]
MKSEKNSIDKKKPIQKLAKPARHERDEKRSLKVIECYRETVRKKLLSVLVILSNDGEFDPGSGRTLAAWI